MMASGDGFGHVRTRDIERRVRRVARRPGLGDSVVDLVLSFDRAVIDRGAEIVVVGPEEVDLARQLGIDIRRALGAQLVVGSDGTLITLWHGAGADGARRRRARRRPLRG